MKRQRPPPQRRADVHVYRTAGGDSLKTSEAQHLPVNGSFSWKLPTPMPWKCRLHTFLPTRRRTSWTCSLVCAKKCRNEACSRVPRGRGQPPTDLRLCGKWVGLEYYFTLNSRGRRWQYWNLNQPQNLNSSFLSQNRARILSLFSH